MKKLFLTALAICSFELAKAQPNTFPASGFVGIGTTTPVSPLNIDHPGAQLRLQGTDHTSLLNEIQIIRNNTENQLVRSPNILFYDIATAKAAYMQSYRGNFQFFPSVGQQKFIIGSDGFVGVNVQNPVAPFQVNETGTNLSIGSANFPSLQGTSYIGFNVTRMASNLWRLHGNASGGGGAVIFAKQDGTLNFLSVPTLNGQNYVERTDDQIKPYIAMQITPGGVVRAKKIVVELTNWPDFVFEKGYNLPTLANVKTYIDKNGHLPDMPSASDVRANGVDLGETNRLLVKKVEELTLYLLEKDAQLKAQDQRLKRLEKIFSAITK